MGFPFSWRAPSSKGFNLSNQRITPKFYVYIWEAIGKVGLRCQTMKTRNHVVTQRTKRFPGVN